MTSDADDVQTVIKSPSRPEFGELEFFVQNDDGSNNLAVRVQQRIKAEDGLERIPSEANV